MTGKQQSPDPSQEDRVQGERETSSVTRVLSVQSRVSNWLAIGLMSAFGLGSLAWYYTNALTRQTRAKESAQAASNKRAQADMPLPSLGRIDPPSTPVLGAAVRSENWPRPDPPQEEQRSAGTVRHVELA